MHHKRVAAGLWTIPTFEAIFDLSSPISSFTMWDMSVLCPQSLVTSKTRSQSVSYGKAHISRDSRIASDNGSSKQRIVQRRL